MKRMTLEKADLIQNQKKIILDIHVQGRAKVKVLRNEIEIETGPGEARLEGLLRTDSKTGSQLKEQPKERV